MSGEHYISKSLLAEIGATVSVGGLRWLGPDTRKDVGISSLTANILCKRHNEALSSLDAHAGMFMRVLKYIDNDLATNSTDIPHENNYLLSGEILECWMLKVLLGVHFSKNAFGPEGATIDNFGLNMERVSKALYEQSWHERCGLYIALPPGETTTSLSFEVMVLAGLSKNAVYGARIRIYGMEFYILLDDLDGNTVIPNPEMVILRPSNITHQCRLRTHRIVLTWASLNPASARGVTFTRKSCSPAGGSSPDR